MADTPMVEHIFLEDYHLRRKREVGARAMQILVCRPECGGHNTTYGRVVEYKKCSQSSVKAVCLHAAYLVVCGSSTEIYTYSMQSLMDHLKIAEVIEGVIFHLGSTKGGTREEGFAREIEAMKKVLQAVPGKAQLIMENTAGGGDKIGAEIVDIERLMHGVNSPRVKVCYDTAHGFEAGLVESYTQASVKKLFDEFDKELGVENIVAIHANDSKTISGSNHDQHENIGDGHIGIEGFKALAGEKRLYNKAWLLEVPGFLCEGPDEENIKLLTSCFK